MAPPGTDTLHASPGFGLFTRALAGGGCLRGLRDLAISRLALPAPAAAALAQALHGHPRLQSLELWNVELDDEGGMAVARLAASASCPALAKLNLGRHLMGPRTTKTIESMLDGSAVRLSM